MAKFLKNFLLATFFFSSSFCFAPSIEEEYRYFDELAIAAGSNKSNYSSSYAKYLAPLKDTPIKLVEIGVHQEATVHLWENYFRNSELHFVDMATQNGYEEFNHSHYYGLNLQDPIQLSQLLQRFQDPFDVIIDNESPSFEQRLTTFIHFFPRLKSKGIYFLEGIGIPSFFKGDIKNMAFVFLQKKANSLNLDPTIIETLTAFKKDVEAIFLHNQLAIIIKK